MGFMAEQRMSKCGQASTCTANAAYYLDNVKTSWHSQGACAARRACTTLRASLALTSASCATSSGLGSLAALVPSLATYMHSLHASAALSVHAHS